MTRRRLLLLAFALLIPAVLAVSAPSSTNFVTQRFVVVGGASADSVNFSVTSVIGQPATNIAMSSNYKVSGGFLRSVSLNLRADTWTLFE